MAPARRKTAPILEVLLPTIPARSERFSALAAELDRQRAALADPEEVWLEPRCSVPHRDGGPSVGAVRRRMIEQARGRYVCFVDDDDAVAPDYLARLLLALAEGPDAVGFWVIVDTPLIPGSAGRWCANSNRGGLPGPEFGEARWPIGIRNPVRRDMAVIAARTIPDISYGEDVPYARALFPMVKTEAFVDAPLYTYTDNPKESATHWAAGQEGSKAAEQQSSK